MSEPLHYPAPPPGYAYVPLDPALVTALPVEERTSSSFYRTPRWRWWRPLVALVVAVVVVFTCIGVVPVFGLIADGTDLLDVAKTQQLKLGPWGFLANNVGLALCIPVAMVVQWLFFGQRPGWLSSITGRFRWRWFATCLAVVLPIWLVLIGVEYALGGLPEMSVRPYTALMIVGILLTTPFQAAGEEYLMRGLEQRLVASYFPSETVGWVIGTLVSSLTFMSLHYATDIWLNIFYFCFGALASWICWRTGGLEAAVAIHVVNNLTAEALMPWTDFSGMFDRGKGAGDPSVLLQVGVLVLAVAIIAWLGKRRGIPARSAPGLADVQRAQATAAAAINARASWTPPHLPPAPSP